MGLEKDDEPRKRKLPPVFTGNAIELRFPNFIDEHKKEHPFRIITFPDYVHLVYINDTMYKVLGKDLELGMPFVIDGNYIPVIDINKEYLYHGMMIQQLPIGTPCDPAEIKRYKFTRLINPETGYQTWDIKEISEEGNITN